MKVKIEDIFEDQSVMCSDGIYEAVLAKTSSSVLITQTKRTDKGINCTSWVAIDEFEKKGYRLTNSFRNSSK